MGKTKQRKVGDRIFYEKYDGTICTAIIKKIEDAEYKESQGYGKPDKVVKYKKYHTGVDVSIENYMCLSDNDPRVKAFCKGKKFITADFADELRQFLVEHGAHKGDDDVAQILYDMAKEFGA